MTILELEQELRNLESQREQAIGNVNAIGGAIQFAKQMLAKMQAPPMPTPGLSGPALAVHDFPAPSEPIEGKDN